MKLSLLLACLIITSQFFGQSEINLPYYNSGSSASIFTPFNNITADVLSFSTDGARLSGSTIPEFLKIGFTPHLKTN